MECSALAGRLQSIYLKLRHFPGTFAAPQGRHHSVRASLDDSTECTSGRTSFATSQRRCTKDRFDAVKSALKSPKKIHGAQSVFTKPNQCDLDRRKRAGLKLPEGYRPPVLPPWVFRPLKLAGARNSHAHPSLATVATVCRPRCGLAVIFEVQKRDLGHPMS